jgi:hypothetical protein
MAVAAFGVLTGAFAEGMARAAMTFVEERCDEINARIDEDNQGREPANCTPNIMWGGQVARLMRVNHGTMHKWRSRPWRMQFGEFCRLALIFGLRLGQMPPPADPRMLLDQAYARAMNWLLLQFRDGRLPRPSNDDLPQIELSIGQFATAFAEDAAQALAAAQAAPAGEADEEEEEETADDPNPRVTAVWQEFANGWLPPLRVQRQRNQLRGFVEANNAQDILTFMQQQFDRRVRELLDNDDYASLLRMVNWCTPAGEEVPLQNDYTLVALPHDGYGPNYRITPVTDEVVRRLRQGEYDEIAAEHLDAYEVLLDLLFLLPPLDPLGDDPVE